MKYILLITTLFINTIAFSQPKIMQGAQAHPLLPDVPWQLIISADGKLLAVGNNFNYNIYDLEQGSVQRLERKKYARMLSPNFESAFDIDCCYDPLGNSPIGFNYFSSFYGLATEDPSFIYKDSLIVVGASKTGEVYVTSSWKKQVYNYGKRTGVGGYIGLWTADPNTGKLLKQLRNDTLAFNNNEERFYPNHKFTASALVVADGRGARPKLRILPFGSDNVFEILSNYKGPINADDNYLYLKEFPYALEVIDLKTGENILKVAAKGVLGGTNMYCDDCGEFLFADNAIYSFNRNTGDVRKFSITNKELKEETKWKVPLGEQGINMAKGQLYVARIVAGPSLLVLPHLERENDNDAGNEAFLVDLPSEKLKLKIAPFYHVSQEIKAYNATVREKNLQAEKEREAAKKAELAKKAAACAEKFAKSGNIKGRTYKVENDLLILDGYDCEKNAFIFWRPRQGFENNGDDLYRKVYANPVYGTTFPVSREQYVTCPECDGDGHFEVTEYTTKTKDLPWGYFSGIETKKITTTSISRLKTCTKCKALGLVLK